MRNIYLVIVFSFYACMSEVGVTSYLSDYIFFSYQSCKNYVFTELVILKVQDTLNTFLYFIMWCSAVDETSQQYKVVKISSTINIYSKNMQDTH